MVAGVELHLNDLREVFNRLWKVNLMLILNAFLLYGSLKAVTCAVSNGTDTQQNEVYIVRKMLKHLTTNLLKSFVGSVGYS